MLGVIFHCYAFFPQHDAYIQGPSGLDCHNEIAVSCHEPLLEGLGLGLR